MYSCEVMEFGAAVNIGYLERILFIDCYSIYSEDGEVIKNINIDRFNDVIRISDGAVWVTSLGNPEHVFTTKIELSNLSAASILHHSYSNGVARVGNRFFEVTGRRDKTKIICVSECSGSVEFPIPRLKRSVFSYKNYIYALDQDNSVYCFDENLMPIWVVKNISAINTSNLYLDHPIFFNEFVICNLGRFPSDEESSFHVHAYDVSTGKKVWGVVLDSPLQSGFLVKGKLYLSTERFFFRLNALDGIIEVKQEFFYKTSDGKPAVISAVYPVKDGLLCFNHQNHFIELRAPDAQMILQIIKLPETYSYSFNSSPPVLEYDGKYYLVLDHLVLGLNPMKSAVAILTPSSNAVKNCDALLESRPPYTVEPIKDKLGKNGYLVKMKGDDHNKIIRYACVVLKELAFKSGVTRLLEFETRDKNNSGSLILELDTSQLELSKTNKNWNEIFSVIKDRTELELKDSHVLAGDGESYFQVELKVV